MHFHFRLAVPSTLLLAASFVSACSTGGDGPGSTTTGSSTGSTSSGAASGSGGAPASGGQGAGAQSSGGGDPTGGSGAGASSSGGSTTSGDGGGDGAGGAPVDDGKTTYVYVGSGNWGEGNEGLVSVYTLDPTSGSLAFVSDHPAGNLASSLAVDATNARLYAGDESTGGVNSFTINTTTGSLSPLGGTANANTPVYVAVNSAGDYLLAANYNQGNVDVYPIGQNGLAGTSLGATSTGAQAHCVWIDDDNHVYVANKAANTISLFDFSAGTLTPKTPATVALESPRHIYRQGNRAYVVSETANLITAYDVGGDGLLTKDWDAPRLASGDAGTDTGAHIHVTSNGSYLYASNRGSSNTIVAYDITGATPSLIEHESTQGTTPRNFDVDPLDQHLVVGNQDSSSVVVFTLGADGSLDHASTLDVSYSPFFVAIARF